MAITVSNSFPAGVTERQFNIIASATADKTATIVHGLAIRGTAVNPLTAPASIQITPYNVVGNKAAWTVVSTGTNTTNLILVKISATATAANTEQIRVTIRLPHSIVR